MLFWMICLYLLTVHPFWIRWWYTRWLVWTVKFCHVHCSWGASGCLSRKKQCILYTVYMWIPSAYCIVTYGNTVTVEIYLQTRRNHQPYQPNMFDWNPMFVFCFAKPPMRSFTGYLHFLLEYKLYSVVCMFLHSASYLYFHDLICCLFFFSAAHWWVCLSLKSSFVAKSKLIDEGVQSPKVIPQEADELSEEEEHCVCCTLGSNKKQKQL